MIIPNDLLVYWFRLLLNAHINRDWELVSYILLDLEKVYKKITQISSKKQLQKARKEKKMDMNKYLKMARKKRYKKIEEEK